MHAVIAGLLLFGSWSVSQQDTSSRTVIEIVHLWEGGDKPSLFPRSTERPAITVTTNHVNGASENRAITLPSAPPVPSRNLIDQPAEPPQPRSKTSVKAAPQSTSTLPPKSPATQSPDGKRPPAAVSHIDTAALVRDLLAAAPTSRTPGPDSAVSDAAAASRLDSYFGRLKGKLRLAFALPPSVSEELSARVEFHVAADGAITQVRLVRPSGNVDFDRSVLEAFRHLPPVGPRPDGRGDLNELEFGTRDVR
jgi:TonB family protein